jgi:hypothetical protein
MMKQPGCPSDKEVMMAMRSQRWAEGLRQHVSGCAICSETVRVSQLLHGLRESAVPQLPSYRVIWLKAQYARRQERLTKLDIAFLCGISVLGFAALAGFFLWQFPTVSTGALHLALKSLPDVRGLFTHHASLTVTLVGLIMVWIITRDTFTVRR